MKNNFKSIFTAVLAMVLCLVLVGCGQTNAPAGSIELTQGGVLCLKVNPEIAISYDADGKVTGVESRNADAAKLLESYTGYEGKDTRDVVTELVNLIGEAGYFVEEVEGESRKITIEIEVGSKLPSDTFLDDVIADVKASIDAHDWTSPIDVTGDIYELPEYVDTDYGPNNDGVTDYDDTDYGPNSDGVTDYNDTDYGPNNDGVTDYDDTDYGPNSDGVTDYNDTDYGPNSDGVTDYDDTDYGPNNDGVTDYDDTDYGPNNDGVTDYDDTDYGPNNDGVTDYDDGDTNYDDDGKTDYDD
ncbi:MAG: hypothetical protein IJX71_02075 [Oscillospiraceae bacterium]|nr:hypothetical protein [Oscillospiraceae bacterium]